MPAGLVRKYTVWRNDTVHTSPFVDDSKRILPGDTLFWSGIVALWGTSVEALSISIPQNAKDLLDSAGLDATLNNLIVPVYAPKDFDLLIDGWGSTVDLFTAEQDKSAEKKYWARFDSIGAKEQDAHWLLVQHEYPYKQRNNIRHLYSEIEPHTSFFDSTFSLYTPSFAVSFWIERNGEVADSADNSDSIEILSAGTDTLGLKIAQCEKDAQFICTTIHSGIDTDSSDNAIYGKAKVLDGKRHHVSLAIHEKHLTIAIDGETIRDTDLKLAENFDKDLRHIQVGDEPLEDFIVYYFDDSIRKDEDKDWTRLKAWLMAFYELQKQ